MMAAGVSRDLLMKRLRSFNDDYEIRRRFDGQNTGHFPAAIRQQHIDTMLHFHFS